MRALGVALILAGGGLGCNALTGFDSLDKVDCLDCGTGAGGAGGTSGAGGTAAGGNAGGAGVLPTEFSALVTGRYGSCVLTMSDGQLRCWGEYTGDGTADAHNRPVVVDIADAASTIQGFSHRCTQDINGGLWCWGRNDFGQLGDGTNITRLVPTKVPGLSDVTKVSAGAYHTCATTSGTNHFCWGSNAHGQLGTGDNQDRNTPTPITFAAPVDHFGAGVSYTCAVLDGGELVCWGLNDGGQLGLPLSTFSVSTPTTVTTMLLLERVYPGNKTTCGRVLGNKDLVCWGNNDFGQVGDGTTMQVPSPVVIPQIVKLGVAYPGLRHTCATDTNNPAAELLCWGANDNGQLGLAMPPQIATPQLVAQEVTSVGAKTSEHTCYVDGDGALLCAGLNDVGQLGDGTYESRNDFLPVQF
jgi:alpha-tubulin suppressor-like RCC1 family protein